jgi:hypothetical protein
MHFYSVGFPNAAACMHIEEVDRKASMLCVEL